MLCRKCGTENRLDGIIGRGEVCRSCGSDLRSCINCGHYDPGLYNSCREPQAERVMDKGKRNFCDFFTRGKGRDRSGKNRRLNPIPKAGSRPCSRSLNSFNLAGR